MKKITLLFFSFCLATQVFAQSENINLANQFLADFKAKKFEVLSNYFDASIADKITVKLMQQTHTALTAQFGDLRTGDAEETKSGQYQLVKMPVLNEPQNMVVQFIFNAAHKMLGFTLVPKPKVSLYKDPAYADASLYVEEKITITSGNFKLPGILTKPKTGNDFPVVILVHGSGPGDRDATVGNTKAFRDLALGLAAKGIATIRYDKRTRVYGPKSAPDGVALTIKEEVTDDVQAAVRLAQQLPGLNAKKIVVLGHSLGAMLAPKIAAEQQGLAGIIMMSAPARPFGPTIKDQFAYLIKDQEQLQKQLHLADEITHADTVKDQHKLIMGIEASYFTNLNQYNQVKVAKALRLPILVLQGERDYQVTLKDLAIWRAELGKNKNVTIKSYPKLNHLYTEGEGALSTPAEYETPANVPLYVIEDIANWILKH
ncbi:alpha/beta hydrolase [Pedobacter sp. ASV12]|uniref:alpha/beta hydrolase n=1 Tax=Pedobacter sp. ASV12 TaxID=2795120 RepID=UPI0018EB07D4|nr:alpha/beta fold hydrolase [Pedobacter sp. ASV12]